MPPVHPIVNHKPSPELVDIAEQVGEFMEYWGFKRIHGKIWAHLFLSAKPLDAGDLIKRLKVSKALISISIADLLKYEVIEELGKSDKGTLLYQANAEVIDVILNVLRQREQRMMARIKASCSVLKKLSNSGNKEQQNTPLSQERVNALFEMVELADDALASLILLKSIDLLPVQEFSAKL